jgi:spermidine synthase
LAPLLFSHYVELHLGIVACCVITMIVLFRDRSGVLSHGRPAWAWLCIVLAFLGLARGLRIHALSPMEGEMVVTRNFYGVLRVGMKDGDDPDKRQVNLAHGRIMHGRQFTAHDKRSIPTAYYGEQSGIGLTLRDRPERPLRVGMVGLGAGTLAAYGRAGDVFRFYEINPDVIRLAESHFTFLKDSKAQIEMSLGDARLSLEREPPQNFDVLVLDAFSSDAIPAHLLTREAFEIYRKHLRPDGVIAVHISNRYFDLEPVVLQVAKHFELQGVPIHSARNEERAQTKAEWILLTTNQGFLVQPELQAAAARSADQKRARKQTRLWTDNYSNLVQILK